MRAANGHVKDYHFVNERLLKRHNILYVAPVGSMGHLSVVANALSSTTSGMKLTLVQFADSSATFGRTFLTSSARPKPVTLSQWFKLIWWTQQILSISVGATPREGPNIWKRRTIHATTDTLSCAIKNLSFLLTCLVWSKNTPHGLVDWLFEWVIWYNDSYTRRSLSPPCIRKRQAIFLLWSDKAWQRFDIEIYSPSACFAVRHFLTDLEVYIVQRQWCSDSKQDWAQYSALRPKYEYIHVR